MVLKIAHRGASGYALQNSLESFYLAKLLRADIIETDIRMTLDKKFVIYHDDNLILLTNILYHPKKLLKSALGFIRLLTLEEISALRLKNKEKIPTLEETIILAKENGIRLKIDVKSNYCDYNELFRIIKKYDFIDQTIISGKIRETRLIKEKFPNISIIRGLSKEYLKKQGLEKVIEEAKENGINIIEPEMSLINKEVVTCFHERGISMHAPPMNESSLIKQAIKAGVMAITTDYLDKI